MQTNSTLQRMLRRNVVLCGILSAAAVLTGCLSESEWKHKYWYPGPFTPASETQQDYIHQFGWGPYLNVIEEYDPAPDNSPPIPNVPSRPFLQRQSNCSLTRFAFDTSGNLLSTYPNYQDYLHTVSGLATTPDQFPGGCKDPGIGIMSQQAFSLGPVASGNLAGGIVSSDGVTVAIVNGTTYALVSTKDYPSIPSPNPDSLAPQSVTAADLNHDGAMDVIVVNSGTGSPPGTVAVFLGNGDGTLKTPTIISLPIVASAVSVEDVNNDGKLDLVVLGLASTFTSGAVVTLLGNGDGTFQAPVLGPTLTRGSADAGVAVVADFNNDGNKDIATSMGQILLGKGDGTFSLLSQPAFASPNGVISGLATGDLNHDGKIDLAISNPQSNSIDIYLGNGDGTFTPKASCGTMFGVQTVTITDLDGDGNPDIFVGAAQGGIFGGDVNTQGIFQSLMGRGDGTFVAATNYSSNAPVGSNAATFGSVFDVADFNGDGKPDIVRLDQDSNGSLLQVLTGQSDGSFVPGPQTAITLTRPFEGLVTADVNGDGKPDVVFASSDTFGSTGSSVGVVFGKGDGTFQAQANYAVTGVITSLTVADVNGDGFPDIIVATGFWPDFSGGGTSAQLYLLLNNRDGTFQTPKLIDSQPYLFQVAAKDVNGDGHVDLVVTAGGSIPAKVAGAAYLYLGNGDGTFRTATPLNITGSSYPAAVAIADLNRDGKPDVIIIDFSTGNLLVLLGNGDGTFQNPTVIPTPNHGGDRANIGIADLNGSGIPDLLLPGFETTGLGGKGDGTFNGPGFLFAAPESTFVKLVDVNGDGLPDILITSGSEGLQVLLSSKQTLPAATATTTTLSTSSASILFGQSVTLTATVKPATGTGTPTGSVSFMENGTTLGTVPLSSQDVAAFSTSSLAAGTHAITAVYSGDVNFASSTSTAVTVAVSAVTVSPSTLSFAAQNLNTTSAAQKVTVTNNGSGMLSVSAVTISGINAGDFAQTNTCASGVLGGANCTISITFTPTASGSRTASLSITDNDAASPQTVSLTGTGGSPDFAIAGTPASATVTAGSAASYTMTITPSNGFNQALTLACSGLPNLSSCGFTPPGVTPSGSAVTSIMAISTTATTTTTAGLVWPASPDLRTIALAGLFASLFAAGRMRRRGARLLSLLIVIILAAVLQGCGGGGGRGKTITNPGTTPGTYTVTVTATTAGNSPVSHNTAVTLTVQ